jgi:phage terminase large subunit GpA-like protein
LPRVIEESDKSELNARGRYVAAGQRIDRDGNVTGSPARTALDVCSPFVTFGDIASIRRRAANAVQRSRAKFNLHGQIGVHVRAASFACKERSEPDRLQRNRRRPLLIRNTTVRLS